MKVGAAAAVLWILPITAAAQPTQIRGAGIDERLGEPTVLESPDAKSASDFFVQLFVPRALVERAPGEYAFEALDDRVRSLDGTTVFLVVEGMPVGAESGEAWQSYVRGLAERYASKVRGFVLGTTDPAATEPTAAAAAFLLKLAAVQIRSVRPESLVFEGDGRAKDPERLAILYREDIAPYFDGTVVPAEPTLPRDEFDARLRELRSALDEYDPTAQILVSGVALSGGREAALRRAIIDMVANRTAAAAVTTFAGDQESVRRLVALSPQLSPLLADRVVPLDEGGDTALSLGADASVPHRLLFNADNGSTLLVYWAETPPAEGRAIQVSLRSVVPVAPTLTDPIGGKTLPILEFDHNAQSNLARARVPLSDRPLILDFPAPVAGATVTASAGLQVGEILARHREAEARQANLLHRYYASVRDEIHFRPSPVDSFDVIIESRFYTDREGSEWEELSFSFNGARWGSDRPAFPLLQPEKVLSLPLDLRLDEDYQYELLGREALAGRDCYLIRFEPLAEGRSLYSGRVWIDAETFAKLKVETLQKELSAPVVSNAEIYKYEPQAVVEGVPVYLLSALSSKQLILIAGRNLLVEKESRFYDFHVNSEDFEALRDTARASNHIMLRDTDEGLRYFVKREGVRQVSQELTRSAKALALGTTIDPSFDFPLPIVGLNYLDFDFMDRGAQFALLFGGIFGLGNIQKPGIFGGAFDASLDFFGIAIKSNDVVFNQDGKIEDESLTALPASLGFNLGWQATDFHKFTARYDLRYDHYGRDETTAEDFLTPTSTFTNGFTLGYEFRKRGYSLLGSSTYGRRAEWEPWGHVEEFDPASRSYWRYRAVLGKDFFFKTFHKIHVDSGWFGGERLDRFTKYQFGLFDETRVRGVPSTAVRFAELILARASYSFNVFDQFRVEVFYDQGWGDDRAQGLERVRFSGLGLGLNLRGPRHTIIRLDVGKGFLPESLRGAGTVVMQFLILKPL